MATSRFDTCVAAAVKKFDQNIVLKDQQLCVLNYIFNGHDTVAVLPTGFGKSLIFQLIPLLLTEKYESSINLFTLVITPISAIMDDQMISLLNKGIKAGQLSADGSNFKTYICETGEIKEEVKPVGELINSDISLLYSHPESLTNNNKVRKLISSKPLSERICCIAVDEVHMISEWGDEFRPSFRKLGDLTALFPEIAHLALTATATKDGLDKLINILQYRNVKKVVCNPDRPNIYYEKKSRLPNIRKLDKFDDLISPLCQELKEQRTNYPVTIVYVESLDSLGYCYKYLEQELGRDAYEPKENPIPENRIFGMYHKDYTRKMKACIIKELCNDEPKLRLILATVALGMGLNAKSVERVIHFRPPTTLEKYMQESGRAGRSGKEAQATLYYNNNDIASNRPGITKDMQSLCRNSSTCLRIQMLKYFGFEEALYTGDKSKCCSNCRDQS